MTSPRSSPSRSLSALKTSPVEAIALLVAASWASSVSNSLSNFSVKPGSVPKNALMSGPRPWTAAAWDSIQVWNALRVLASKVERISSSSTVGATWPGFSVPPSATFGPLRLPGVSST